jgi:hypothetical protein
MPSFYSSTTAPVSRRSAILAPPVELREHIGAGRDEVESFIRERFASSFHAQVDAFMPRLFSLRNQADEICVAFGLRSATRSLFLEQYLDLPIECEIAVRCGHAVQRHSIVEVGQFCGTHSGVARSMISLLTQHLHGENFEWVAFTGTAPLRNTFSRMGLSPIDIRAADAARLPAAERAAWGSYYENAPRVLAGRVGQDLHTVIPHRAPRAFTARAAA